jgi:transcriptional regulator with XRE-family HTH domain
MVKRSDIDKFYEDVKSLDLRFPVAAISRATGQSKANVSKYISGKLEPSETFLKAFNEAFQISGKNVSRETISQQDMAEKVKEFDFLYSVFISEVAALKIELERLTKPTAVGNSAVEARRIYKAAEDLKSLGD